MAQITRDPILHFTAAFVSVLKWLMLLVGWLFVAMASVFALVVALDGLGIFKSRHLDGVILEEWFAIVAVFGLVIILSFLFAKFFKTLRAIIDSVEHGAALTFANAERLKTMAILLSIGLILGLAADFFGGLMAPVYTEDGSIDTFDLYYDVISNFLTTLLPILLLVILSRIFERGAEMREELEGTV